MQDNAQDGSLLSQYNYGQKHFEISRNLFLWGFCFHNFWTSGIVQYSQDRPTFMRYPVLASFKGNLVHYIIHYAVPSRHTFPVFEKLISLAQLEWIVGYR